MNDTILREEPIHWVQSPSQTAEASSVGAWSTEAVVALFDQPFTELLFRAQTVHREHFDPTEVELAGSAEPRPLIQYWKAQEGQFALPGVGLGGRAGLESPVVHLDQAAGEFCLTRPAPAKILFLTAGSGITPVMGMLRNISPGDATDVVVVHSAPTATDVIFGGELRMLAGRGRIRLVEIHTDTDGRLDPTRLTGIVDDLAERHTWACGPTGLLDDLETQWAAEGFVHQLHTERFRPALIATGDGALSAEHRGTVTFSGSGTTVEAGGDRSLLETGEAAGVLMPSGCRMGICFGCVAPLRRGAVRDLRDGEITTAAPGDGVVIQTCISAAAGACEIEL
jgi:ferredoxin